MICDALESRAGHEVALYNIIDYEVMNHEVHTIEDYISICDDDKIAVTGSADLHGR